MDEVRKEVMILEEMGHKRLALEAGEDPVNCDIEYILDCIDTIYDTYNKNGKIRRINVNIAATTVENYRRLQEKELEPIFYFKKLLMKRCIGRYIRIVSREITTIIPPLLTEPWRRELKM